MTRPTQAAVSLKTAASRLGLTPQRVSQMLTDGDLRGPSITGNRAAPNAPRVWESSLEELIAQRAEAAPGESAIREFEARLDAVEARQREVDAATNKSDDRLRLINELRATKDAALVLNAVIDDLQAARNTAEENADRLEVENADLRRENTDLKAEIEALRRSAVRARRDETNRRVDEARSRALTQLLAPSNVGEMFPNG